MMVTLVLALVLVLLMLMFFFRSTSRRSTQVTSTQERARRTRQGKTTLLMRVLVSRNRNLPVPPLFGSGHPASFQELTIVYSEDHCIEMYPHCNDSVSLHAPFHSRIYIYVISAFSCSMLHQSTPEFSPLQEREAVLAVCRQAPATIP